MDYDGMTKEEAAKYETHSPDYVDTTPTLQGDESLSNPPYIQYPKIIQRDNRISMAGRFLYGLLLGYQSEKKFAYPGQAKLCDVMGVTDKTLRLAMQELSSIGLVKIIRRGQGKQNIYYVHDCYRHVPIQLNFDKTPRTGNFPHQEKPVESSVSRNGSESRTGNFPSQEPEPLRTMNNQGEGEPDEGEPGDYILHTREERTDNNGHTPTLKDNGTVSDYDNESQELQTFAIPVPESETPESPNPVIRTLTTPSQESSSNPKSETFPQAGGLSVRPAATGKTYENFKPKLSPPLKGATQATRLFAMPLPDVKNEKSREAMLADLTEGGLVEPGRNPLRYYLQSFARKFNRVPEVGAYATAAVRLRDLVTRQGAEEYAQRLGRFFLDPNQQSRGYTYTNFLVCFDSYAFDKASIEVKSAGTRQEEATMNEIRRTLSRYADAGLIERG